MPIKRADLAVAVGLPRKYGYCEAIALDKCGSGWYYLIIMRQINRKNTWNWRWPVGQDPTGVR
jgi:hypothetical protein